MFSKPLANPSTLDRASRELRIVYAVAVLRGGALEPQTPDAEPKNTQ